jgi:hypothetical protein
MGNAQLFPRRNLADAAMQIQPLGTADHADSHPRIGAVEFTDQLENTVRGGGDFTPELGDLILDGRHFGTPRSCMNKQYYRVISNEKSIS